LTPPSSRPYVGCTTDNSMLELALQHDGINRFSARSRFDAQAPSAAQDLSSDGIRPVDRPRQRPRIFDDSPTGVLRLFRPQEAAQAAWWLPLAFAGALLGWFSPKAKDTRRKRALIGMCGGWAATFWLAFSFAGGIVHSYYLAVLGPPLAVLGGIGISELCARWKSSSERAVALPALLTMTLLGRHFW
jgi:4-amino-4-deoxy-L-arabinose transferase-like glycosyltransferase